MQAYGKEVEELIEKTKDEIALIHARKKELEDEKNRIKNRSLRLSQLLTKGEMAFNEKEAEEKRQKRMS